MKQKILVIENDDSIKEIIKLILTGEGYEVIGAAYAEDNLLQLKPDLILLDEWINRREGHMLCKEIKAISAFAKVPVIIFSTAANILDIVAICGADGYVQKPFDVDILLNEIRRLLPAQA